VIEAVSGQSWEDFVQTRILDRGGVTETVPLARLADPQKSALPHGRVGPPLRYLGAMTQIADSIVEVWNWDSAAAAGGICTTTTDWAKWMTVRLKEGELADGSRLFSQAAAREMWKPNVIVSSSAGPTAELPNRAIASTYAMGFQVQDYRGERLISHGGGSPGGISATVLIPGRNLGFCIFSNAEESFLLRALRSGIADICMSKVDTDWIADSKRLETQGAEKSIAAAAEIDAKQAAGAPPAMPLEAYAGVWRDPWYGDIPYDGETFRTRFPDKREEDAFITFAIQTARPATATVKGVSPDIDFSYDYQDLRLTRAS
ncbi:hypothetical protein LTR94_024745, partial [Friedmanniomyces endolithicus]